MAMDQLIDAQVTGHRRRHVHQLRIVLLRRHAMLRPIGGDHPTGRGAEALYLTGNRHHLQTDRQALILHQHQTDPQALIRRRAGRVHRMEEEEVVQWEEEAVLLAEAVVEEGDRSLKSLNWNWTNARLRSSEPSGINS
jgi:hypothetical protein